jgi:hypothetical protein
MVNEVMIEKRGVKVYKFSQDEDRKELEKIFNSLLEIEDLVPMIGSGFTRGLRTKNGVVPSVDELREEMTAIMHIIDGSDEDEFADIMLADFADAFWEELEKSDKHRCKERFQEYIESNFTKVYDVEQSKRHLLNSNWKTIFTLNYDDTIESVLDIDVVVPYDKFNIRSGKSSLIKLHGDASRFSVTGDPKYCVLGNQQYVALIKEKSNADIVNVLENIFFSKSVFFIGCSLDNELDLLYSAGVQLGQKAKLNSEHHIIYLLYGDEAQEINPLPYKKYGITDIIRVDQKTVIELYEFIYTISKKLKSLCEKDLLQEYTNIKFEYLDGRNNENIDYLFYNDKLKINNGIIKYPTFFVERNCIKGVQEKIISGKGVFHIIYGSKFSGKTYALLQLLRNLINRKVYYFPSYITLSDDIIENLHEKENSIFLIDEGAISFEQYKDVIVPQLHQFEKAQICIVMTVSKGDADFYRHYRNFRDTNEETITLYELKNKLDSIEYGLFNKRIGDVSLVPYDEGDTILDYLLKAEDNMLKKKQKSYLPKVHFLSNDCEKEVRTLIILATKNSITSEIAIDLGIDSVLYDFSKNLSAVVQKDYLSDIEKKGDIHSGFKFILNSAYWAKKCLSNFAFNSYNHKTVVKAYCNIVNAYSHLEQRDMNSRIKIYYMLDRIQYLFSDKEKKGTIKLPYLVYEGLHTALNWNYQFLHQEAKCELRMAKREKNIKEKKKILELAYRNINRAMDLAGKSVSENIEYTVAHMNVTKALILINYIFAGENNQLVKTIDVCYEVFVVGESLCPQLQKEEMKDVKVFLDKYWKEGVEENVKDKFNALYTSYIRKPSWAMNGI